MRVNLSFFLELYATLNALRQQLTKKVESVTSDNFESLALEVFQYQAEHNLLYRQYLQLLNILPASVTSLAAIPLLPIQFFKNYVIKSGENWQPEAIFESSGTTGQIPSRHFIPDLDFYLRNAKRGFEHFYGDLSQYCILALLPSYLERSGSSLVAMAAYFIEQSRYPQSGFFLYEQERLMQTLVDCVKNNIPTILLGVSFALFDLAENQELSMRDHIVLMETGGFKGRKEIIRENLHDYICQKFNLKSVHSEYGMTELLSQAYSKGKGIFSPAPTMQVLTRQITDPLSPEKINKTGLIGVIDLANISSMSFLLTEDLGRVHPNGSFEILGRADNSDIRGCSLLLLN